MRAKTYKFAEKIGHGGLRCPCCVKNATPAEAKRTTNRKFRRSSNKSVAESAESTS